MYVFLNFNLLFDVLYMWKKNYILIRFNVILWRKKKSKYCILLIRLRDKLRICNLG